jgi:multisubunit Na+/H+ antiporter MnhG subunit
MFEEIKNIKTGKKDIRSFGITFGIIFLIIAGFLYYQEKDSFQLFIYLAGSFSGLGIILPIILKPFYMVWMIFAVILGWFMTKVILSLLFYLIITPIGLFLRIIGKDLLDLKEKKQQKSYWNMRNSEEEQNQNYEKQF